MRLVWLLLATTCCICVLGVAALADSSGRIYGKITTVDGDTYTGLIRWDKNEASWVDILNGTKEIPDENIDKTTHRARHKNPTRVRVFGLNIAEYVNDDGNPTAAESGIRFGHIQSIENVDDDAAMITLKSGKKVELSSGSTDIGNDMRELIIEDQSEGETELTWEDVERVELMPEKGNIESSLGERLYGTVTTRRGDSYTGFIAWDVDEVFGSDLLEGESNDHSRKIKFEKIGSIERYSSSGAKVVLKAGEDLVLKGSNDVDESNRGIIVSDPAFGQAIIQWDQFGKLEFRQPPRSPRYEDFDGGRPITGTVTTEDGDTYTGTIRWDNDEEYTWEILDGEYHDVQFDIEFGLIKSIEKQSSRSALVTVSDGRQFRLRGSNDVDDSNKGIFIQSGKGHEIEVDWDDLAKVEFSAK